MYSIYCVCNGGLLIKNEIIVLILNSLQAVFEIHGLSGAGPNKEPSGEPEGPSETQETKLSNYGEEAGDK
jgi:hypothetical protein